MRLAVTKATRLFEEVLNRGFQIPLPTLARELGIPVSTAYRLLDPMFERRLLLRLKRGIIVPGPYLAARARTSLEDEVLQTLARPYLDQLVEGTGRTAHLGVFRDEMVMYLLKAQPKNAPAVFTREGMLLEAYCSGIGKVLLAHLTVAEQDRYLADSSFVPLTANTVTDPVRMRTAWRKIAQEGYAVDDEEVEDGLFCVAVPVQTARIGVICAISTSVLVADARKPTATKRAEMVTALRQVADQIAAAVDFPLNNGS